MLRIVAVILVILWLVGVATGHIVSGFIHILLALAFAAVVLNFIRGRRLYY